MAYKDKEPDEKKEAFETPKMLNLEGKELTEEDLEGAAGGVAADNTCNTGTGSGNDCHTGTDGSEELA